MQELKHGMRKPNKLIVRTLDGVNVVDSREVAKMVNIRHDNLLVKIKKYSEILATSNLRTLDFFIEDTYLDEQEKERPCYQLTRKGCDMVANKMTGEKGVLFTAEYVTRFEEMEEYIKGQAFNTSNLSKELQAIFMLDGKQQELDNRISNLEERMTIETGAQKTLCDLVNKKVIAVLGGKDTPAYQELSKKAFRQCWKSFKDVLQVASYKDTPLKDFELAKKVIIDWQPNRELELMIRGCNAQIRM